MARVASKKPAASTAKPVTKRTAKAVAPKATRVVKKPAPAKKPAAVKAPVLSKEELRTQLVKADKTVATLRAKSRDANRELKAAAARIDELEAQVAQLSKKLAAQPKAAKPAPAPKKPVTPRKPRKVDEAVVELPDVQEVPADEAEIVPGEIVLAEIEASDEEF